MSPKESDGVNCILQNSHVDVLALSTQSVTVFRDRVLKEAIKLK
jgi:hypothetical protein